MRLWQVLCLLCTKAVWLLFFLQLSIRTWRFSFLLSESQGESQRIWWHLMTSSGNSDWNVHHAEHCEIHGKIVHILLIIWTEKENESQEKRMQSRGIFTSGHQRMKYVHSYKGYVWDLTINQIQKWGEISIKPQIKPNGGILWKWHDLGAVLYPTHTCRVCLWVFVQFSKI